MSRAVPWSAPVIGCVFGFLLTESSLGDYSTIHEGLLLRNPYIFVMMGSAMAVAFLGLALLRRRGRTAFSGRPALPHHRVERRHISGGIVIGLGFGVGATCPGLTTVMTTAAGLSGLVVLVGLVGGLWLRGWVERRQQRPLGTELTAPPLTAEASTSARMGGSPHSACRHGDSSPA